MTIVRGAPAGQNGLSRIAMMRVLETCPTGVVIVASDWEVLYCNAVAVQMFGLDRRAMIGADLRIFCGSWRGLGAKPPRQVISQGPRAESDVKLLRPGVGDFWAIVSSEEMIYSGRDAQIIWIRDNSALKAGEEKLTGIFDAAPMPMMLCHAKDGAVITANRRAQELFAGGGRVVNLKLEHVIGPDALQSFLRSIRGGGFTEDFETILITPYGESFWGGLSGQILEIAGEKCILVGLTDISARKLAEETLRRFFDAAPLPMLLARLSDNMVQRANRRATELFAPQSSFEKGGELRPIKYYTGEESCDAFLKVLTEKGFVEGFEVQIATDYGETIWALMSGQTLNVDGERCVLLGVNDITDRKRTEEQLLSAKDTAEQATRAKSAFLATMSHEIRTPMNGVVGMLEVLSFSPLNHEQHDMVSVIHNSAQTLLTIINDILDLSKIEAGKLELEAIVFPLRATIEGGIEILAERAKEKMLDLVWWVAPDVPDILLGDPVRLRQIILNLVGNGLKFTEIGSVTVGVTVVQDNAMMARLRFSVRDSGIGLTEEQLSRMFKPFAQADASTTRRYGGTGLGLSICRQLVWLMGGEVAVESVYGEGSCFWFEIDFAIEAVLARNEENELLLGTTIAVVDAVPETRGFIRHTFEVHGATAIEVADAAELGQLIGPDKTRLDMIVINDEFGSVGLGLMLRGSLSNPPPILAITNACGLFDQAAGDANLIQVCKPLRRSVMIRSAAMALGHWSSQTSKDKTQFTVSHQVSQSDGAVILVAEDNATNRLVIGKQLALIGCRYEMVNDGEQAWAALHKKKYDLLLTDCFMPELDGYELSKRIRTEEQELNLPRLPIIALTANALHGDDEICKQAGMDGYLSKPVAVGLLAATLTEWITAPHVEMSAAAVEAAIPDAPVAGPKSEPKPAPPPLDLAALSELIGDDSPEVLREIVGFFAQSFQPLLDGMILAVAEKDRLKLRNASHSAKGAARNACTPVLAAILEELEEAAPKGGWKRLADLVRRVGSGFVDLEQFVATY